jgi:hypothetical protein
MKDLGDVICEMIPESIAMLMIINGELWFCEPGGEWQKVR